MFLVSCGQNELLGVNIQFISTGIQSCKVKDNKAAVKDNYCNSYCSTYMSNNTVLQ